MLVFTLLFLGAVGLRRTWDLRGYTGDALGLLSGRKHAYGYFHTERLLSQMAQASGDEALTDALAAWTAQLWPPSADNRPDQHAAFYIDGHHKPVYTEALTCLTVHGFHMRNVTSTPTHHTKICTSILYFVEQCKSQKESGKTAFPTLLC